MTRISGLFNQRAKPRIEVPRGYIGVNTANALTAAYPVAADVTVLSGQLIQPTTAGEWVLGGDPSTDFTAVPQFYFAINDSADADVVDADKLPGLSCNGQYEIETAYFAANTYAPGDIVVADSANPGSVKKWDGTDTDDGSAAAQVAVAEVVKVLTGAEVVQKNSHVVPPANMAATFVLRLRTPARNIL
jgi:hypothetical protein